LAGEGCFPTSTSYAKTISERRIGQAPIRRGEKIHGAGGIMVGGTEQFDSNSGGIAGGEKEGEKNSGHP